MMYHPHERVITRAGTVMLTKQSMKDDCDINLIVARHASTGLWEHLNPRLPTYGDYSNATELQEALALVSQAEDDFNALPASVRTLCGNDPVELLRLSADPNGFAELVRAGMPTTPEHEPKENPPIIGGENTAAAETGGNPPADAENSSTT